MKDSRVVTLNTKGSKFTTPATNSISNTYKTQGYRGIKNSEDENTDIPINEILNNKDRDTIKNTPIKSNKDKGNAKTDKHSNLNDLYDISEVELSPMKDKSEKPRKDYYGNIILRRGKKHKITFIDYIKKGNLEDIVNIKKINEDELSIEEIEKKNSEPKVKSIASNKEKNKSDNLPKSLSKEKGNDNNDESSCACFIF